MPDGHHSSPASDQNLVSQWRDGDRAAGEALCQRYVDPLYVFVSSRAPAIAGDVVQQSFLLCAQQLDRLRDAASFRAYLFGIARNLMLQHTQQRAASDRGRRRVSHVEAKPTSPSERVHRDESRERLLEALRSLPLDTQLLLELFYWEEWGTEEIAQALQIERGAVKVRLHRARQRLRDRLGFDCFEGR